MNKEIETVKELILKTLQEMGVSVNKIILFGSRARGSASKYSDYDFLIITEKTFTIKEKMGISKKLRTQLAEFAIDFVIKSEEEVMALKNQIGTVVREALKEGVVL